ncbi:MAG: lipoyl(octanoyl) transferase LipB [Oligoflexia bacterium]|nr:lipoyl(octanoyl) transferase LipB [Oligoflexia bacterium]
MRFWSLEGYTPYEEARELQLKLVELRAADLIPDTVLFLEHEPVITRGRGLQFSRAARPRHMPLPERLPPGIAFAESERGGDLTYHGPGQLVIYPICKLDGEGFGPRRDVTGFLRKIEKVLIEEFSSWGFEAEFRENATGVWVHDRKAVSIGIAVRKWVTYHGVAINCVNDMSPFHLISPCGFSPDVMTCLKDLMAERGNLRAMEGWNGAGWRIALESRLARRMCGGMELVPELRRLPIDEALERVSKLVESGGPMGSALGGRKAPLPLTVTATPPGEPDYRVLH